MHVGVRLKALRLKSGHTQDSLAEKTGVQRPTIQKIEGGANTTIDTLKMLVGGCNSNLTRFFDSHIPDKYENPEHAEIHDKLQVYLQSSSDGDVRAVGIVIDALFLKSQASKKGPQ